MLSHTLQGTQQTIEPSTWRIPSTSSCFPPFPPFGEKPPSLLKYDLYATKLAQYKCKVQYLFINFQSPLTITQSRLQHLHQQKPSSLMPACNHLPSHPVSIALHYVLTFHIHGFEQYVILCILSYYFQGFTTLRFPRMNSIQWCRYAVWALLVSSLGLL